MYLQSISLVGFKSFADRTVLEFTPGVTAIVGPNGCGKSNVSDAIRWVLGEQSARALRGGEMADVIFNGADGRPALSLAEVSLTFAGCKEVLQTGQIAGIAVNFDEVTVTRRIFRDGNSEYFINKTSCRLRDVQSLFMDTGIGRSSYSIMEQGKIDKILSSHPEDRRSVFEEAAGITRYKSQKREAARKLEYTEANMTRLSDTIREVKRQIGSLQRQAGKARRYQALSAEMRHLDTQVARRRYEEIQAACEEARRALDEARDRLVKGRAEIEVDERAVAELRVRAEEAEVRRQGVHQKRRELEVQLERCQERACATRERLGEVRAGIEAAERERGETRERLAETRAHEAGLRQRIESLKAERDRREGELTKARADLDAALAVEREREALIQKRQEEALNAEGEVVNLRNQEAGLERQRQEQALASQKLFAEQGAAREQLRVLRQRQEALQSEIEAFKLTFESSRHALTGGEDALREADQKCAALSAGFADLQTALSEKRSRREVLRQLHDTYEGYSEGARALMGGHYAEVDASVRHAILGALADLLEVEPRYAVAIEAGLGQGLQALVLSESDAALRLVEALQRRNLGRATFALKEEEEGLAGVPSSPRPRPDGALCWATDAVQCRPPVHSLVRNLLADMAIVPDVRTALDLHRKDPGLTLVTVEGDVLDHHGILCAGSPKALPLQVLGRRNEIVALDAEIAERETRLRELSAEKGEWEGRRAAARQAVGDHQTEVRSRESDLSGKQLRLHALHAEIRDAESKIAASEAEARDLEQRRSETASEQERVRAAVGTAVERQARGREEFSAAKTGADEASAESRQRQTAVADLQVAMATTAEQLASREGEIRLVEQRAGEFEQLIRVREEGLREAQRKQVQWEGEIAEAGHRSEGLQASLRGVGEEEVAADREKQAAATRIEEASEKLRETRERVEETQQALTDLEVRLTERRAAAAHLAERIQREHSTDLATVVLLPLKGRGAPAEALPPETASADESSEPSSGVGDAAAAAYAPAAELPFDTWDGVAARAEEVRAKLESLGPVSLEAVQEYQEQEDRHRFLTQQFEDLSDSKDNLTALIRKINVETRRMFGETFEKIRVNFLQVFTELFGGGKADLALLDGDDPLECGIDIVARPPGKQLQNISLLSGGERTMTAVALLFAIYMVKPSPFCVLDEMDAPLDESNIGRFIGMLQRFLEQSQFLIITHNKRTIAMADALYGVTMEERGVSKIVSVRFRPKGEPPAGEKSPAKAPVEIGFAKAEENGGNSENT
ncbi:MAG: chromosome segregation protein SMC [Verrucomicrobiae bacterium]|nr:chromosome segregation protein SMC [Verrucomicrobiae bacterium]